jgi:hypothetical protein
MKNRAGKGLTSWTVNGIRGVLHTVFRRAPKHMFNGPNPLLDVEKVPTQKKIRATLRADDVPAVLRAVPP